MKNMFLVAMLFCACSLTSAAVKFGGGAHAGISISSFPSTISDFYGIGFGGGAHVDAQFVPFLAARFGIDYMTFSSDKDKIKERLAQANGVQASALGFEGLNSGIFSINLTGIGKIQTHSALTPYGLLGFGLNFLSISESKVTFNGQPVAQAGTPSSSETDFGLNFGAGSEFKMGAIALTFEIKYVLIFTSGNSTAHIPILVGVSFGG